MAKVDKTVMKESIYIAVFSLLLSMLLQSFFLIIHQWNVPVLCGNILGYVASVLNFFLMAFTVQKAVGLEEKAAKNKMKLSQMLRMLMLVLFAVVAGVLDKYFDLITFVIPLIFPRIAVAFRPMFNKKEK